MKYKSSQLNVVSNNATSSGSKLPTDDLTLLSNTHGRGRRLERNITKSELKETILHGTKQVANPGRDGSERYRFTYNDVVCITDKTCKQEITAWRLDNKDEIVATVYHSIHFIIVVDCSGSMRKDDVEGYMNRKQAVYNCLINDIMQPQVQLQASSKRESLRKAVATLIEMNDNATVIFERVEISDKLIAIMNERSLIKARSHGNYIPAIDEITKIVSTEALDTQVMIIFLSDGAPSDHHSELCTHGDAVFNFIHSKKTPLHCPDMKSCISSIYTRFNAEYSAKIKQLGSILGENRVQLHTIAFGPVTENYKVLKNMAMVLGEKSSFQKLGLNSLGLSSTFSSFTSTLTSLRTETNTMNTLTTDNKHQHEQLTLRTFTTQDDELLVSDINNKIDVSKWDFYYVGVTLISKEEYNPSGSFIEVPMTTTSGVAVMKDCFAQGAERLAFRCTEFIESKSTIIVQNLEARPDLNGKAAIVIKVSADRSRCIVKIIPNQERVSIDSDNILKISSRLKSSIRVITGLLPVFNGFVVKVISIKTDSRFLVEDVLTQQQYTVKEENFLPRYMVFPPISMGMKLVAKESKYIEKLSDDTFQEKMARLSYDAEEVAVAFNKKLMNIRSVDAIFDMNSFRITFSKCQIYRIKDKKFDDGMGILLSEPELEGKFTKWNNNGGGCNLSTSPFTCIETRLQDLNIIEEGSEEEEDDDNDDDHHQHTTRRRARLDTPEHLAHVPQCFSHFSYCYSKGRYLICDLQGIWNRQDGFTLTDPALHSNSNILVDKKHKYSATDHKFTGIKNFFKTHTCNKLCTLLNSSMLESWYLSLDSNKSCIDEIQSFCVQFSIIKAVPIQEDGLHITFGLELKEWITDIKYILEETKKSFLILFDSVKRRDSALTIINLNKKSYFVEKYTFNAYEL
jgi:hypothetical protein